MEGLKSIPVEFVICTRIAEELLNTSYAEVTATLEGLGQHVWGWLSTGCRLQAAPCVSRVQLC